MRSKPESTGNRGKVSKQGRIAQLFVLHLSPPPLRAAILGDVKGINRILFQDSGAVRAMDDAGRTMLHIVARDGNESAVALVLSARANVDTRDATMCTPLQHAVRFGRDAVAMRLINGRANAAC